MQQRTRYKSEISGHFGNFLKKKTLIILIFAMEIYSKQAEKGYSGKGHLKTFTGCRRFAYTA